jgi:hypothetical protein
MKRTKLVGIGFLYVLDPLGSRPLSASRAAQRRALPSGARIGLLSNGKQNASLLLRSISSELAAKYQFRTLMFDKSVDGPGSAHPSPPEWLAALTSGTSAVIAGVGD